MNKMKKTKTHETLGSSKDAIELLTSMQIKNLDNIKKLQKEWAETQQLKIMLIMMEQVDNKKETNEHIKKMERE